MIFIRYENWRTYLKRYPVTSVLILLNILMFIVLSFNGGSTSAPTLIKYGAIVNHELFAHETWRVITAMFLHNGFAHLLFNMFALYVFAPPLESVLGHFRYATLYLLSGVLGNAAVLWLSEYATLAVGASGAIYGLYGAYLYLVTVHRKLLDEASRKTVTIILVLGLIQSFTPNISWEAHLGGLAAGFIIYALMLKFHRR